jgi:hypothetical protein
MGSWRAVDWVVRVAAISLALILLGVAGSFIDLSRANARVETLHSELRPGIPVLKALTLMDGAANRVWSDPPCRSQPDSSACREASVEVHGWVSNVYTFTVEFSGGKVSRVGDIGLW